LEIASGSAGSTGRFSGGLAPISDNALVVATILIDARVGFDNAALTA